MLLSGYLHIYVLHIRGCWGFFFLFRLQSGLEIGMVMFEGFFALRLSRLENRAGRKGACFTAVPLAASLPPPALSVR